MRGYLTPKMWRGGREGVEGGAKKRNEEISYYKDSHTMKQGKCAWLHKTD